MLGLKKWQIKRLTKKLKQMRVYRVHNQPKDADLKKEVKTWLALADLHKKSIGDKKSPHAQLLMLECYRNAANLGDPEALYITGQYLLNEARFRNQLHKEGLFDSMNNAKSRDLCYEEAHSLLEEAEKYGHIKARRLHGLSLINGWGVTPDTEKGFDLIVQSIKQEDSWDKIPQLFAEMGLNKPEFFSAVMQRKDK